MEGLGEGEGRRDGGGGGGAEGGEGLSVSKCTTDSPAHSSSPDPHPLLHISGSQVLVQADDKLGKLFDLDDILWVICVRIDDLGAPGHLQHTDTHL